MPESKLTSQGIRDLNTYPRNGKRRPGWKLVLCPECGGHGTVRDWVFMEDFTDELHRVGDCPVGRRQNREVCDRCNGDGRIAVPWEPRQRR